MCLLPALIKTKLNVNKTLELHKILYIFLSGRGRYFIDIEEERKKKVIEYYSLSHKNIYNALQII